MSLKWLALLIFVAAFGCAERPAAQKSIAKSDPTNTPTEQVHATSPEPKAAKVELKSEPETKAAAKENAKAKPSIPDVLDPAIQKQARILLAADATEREKAAAFLVAMKRPAIPYLLEVYLDDQDQPRVPVDKALNQVLRVKAAHSIDDEAIAILLDALKHPSAPIRRAAFRSLIDEIIAPKVPESIFDGLRAAAKSDADPHNRQHAKNLLSSTAQPIVDRMLLPSANPADDAADFAILNRIGSEALAPLNRGIKAADVEFDILRRSPSPVVQNRLLRLTNWKLRASNTAAIIRFNSSLGD